MAHDRTQMQEKSEIKSSYVCRSFSMAYPNVIKRLGASEKSRQGSELTESRRRAHVKYLSRNSDIIAVESLFLAIWFVPHQGQVVAWIADRTMLAKLTLPMVIHFIHLSLLVSRFLIIAFSDNPFSINIWILP